METEKEIRARYINIEWALNEKLKRLFAANEAKIFLITTKPQLALKCAVASVMYLLQPEQAALSFFPVQIVG